MNTEICGEDLYPDFIDCSVKIVELGEKSCEVSDESGEGSAEDEFFELPNIDVSAIKFESKGKPGHIRLTMSFTVPNAWIECRRRYGHFFFGSFQNACVLLINKLELFFKMQTTS